MKDWILIDLCERNKIEKYVPVLYSNKNLISSR